MIKRTLNLLITLVLYELAKYVTEQVLIVLTSDDEIDTFNECDYIDLNNLKVEVSG
ncbi:transcriptional activator RinB [Staphylococcus felis]|uniref:Transcriptional regulator n=1 Tax=Staphylococcus felis TaxID=46127 RepID=A0ABS0QQ63_9STAP|nr:transcriptional regulator [Staphylococcus felis]MBH9580895.1 transcriptional regulator [Staphylococcus felis]